MCSIYFCVLKLEHRLSHNDSKHTNKKSTLEKMCFFVDWCFTVGLESSYNLLSNSYIGHKIPRKYDICIICITKVLKLTFSYGCNVCVYQWKDFEQANHII